MKWLLLSLVVCTVLAVWAFKSADRPGDDFGAAIPALGLGALSAILGLVYIALVFWNHRFL